MHWRANQDALIDAGIGPEDDTDPSHSPEDILDELTESLSYAGWVSDAGDTHRLSDRQATVGIWIDGHEYSLTLNRED